MFKKIDFSKFNAMRNPRRRITDRNINYRNWIISIKYSYIVDQICVYKNSSLLKNKNINLAKLTLIKQQLFLYLDYNFKTF